MRIRVPLTAGVVLLCCACTGPAAPTSSSSQTQPTTLSTSTVDVPQYVVGDAALWPRLGSHHQNQIVDQARREVCWVKYGNPRRFECWRWDDQSLYHMIDHALDGDSPESYHFTDGRWLPRFLPLNASAAAPWTLDVASNQIVWFDASCGVNPALSHTFPYRLRAWFEPRRDAGTDLGSRDTLVFEYEPYDPTAPGAPVFPEHFYFGRSAGWYEWLRSGFLDFFNRLGGPSTQMDRGVWCAGANP